MNSHFNLLSYRVKGMLRNWTLNGLCFSSQLLSLSNVVLEETMEEAGRAVLKIAPVEAECASSRNSC